MLSFARRWSDSMVALFIIVLIFLQIFHDSHDLVRMLFFCVLGFIFLSLLLTFLSGKFFFKLEDWFLVLFACLVSTSFFLNAAGDIYPISGLFWLLSVVSAFFWGGAIPSWSRVWAALVIFPIFIFIFFVFSEWASLTASDLKVGFIDYLSGFINTNRFSVICLVSIFFIGGRVIRNSEHGNGAIVLNIFLILFLVWLIFASGSRSAAVISGAFLVLLALYFISQKIYEVGFFYERIRIFVPFMSALAVFSIPALVISGVFYGSGRENLWGMILAAWEESPYFGLGFGAATQVLSDSGSIFSSHNAFLQLFVEFGVFGLLSFMIFLFCILLKPIKFSHERYQFSFHSIIIFFIIVHQSFETLIFHISPFSLLFFAYLGWLSRLNRSGANREAVSFK